MSEEDDQGGLTAIRRALELLLAVGRMGRMGTAEAKRHLNMPPSTAHRHLHTLASMGFLEPASPRGFQLGPAILELSQSALGRADVIEAARPHMAHLRDHKQETVTLWQLEGRAVRVVHAAQGPGALRVVIPIGTARPAYACAPGRMLLAALSPSEVRAHVGPTPDENHLPGEVPLIDLDADLAEVRTRGWAADLEEIEADVQGVAVPLLGKGGRTLAALALAAPASRLREPDLSAVAEALIAAAGAISKGLH